MELFATRLMPNGCLAAKLHLLKYSKKYTGLRQHRTTTRQNLAMILGDICSAAYTLQQLLWTLLQFPFLWAVGSS